MLIRPKIKPSEHALVVSGLLLHIKDTDDQSLQKLQTAAERWVTEASAAEYWLYMLEPKDAHLSGLDSLQGKDRVIAEVLKDLQGIGLLDAYTVKVGCCDSYTCCLWDGSQYDLDSIDNRQTTIGHWMSLDGSKPGFPDIRNDDSFHATDALDERIMQGKEYFDIQPPDKEEVYEYPDGHDNTVSVDRLYERSAIMFWPRSHRWLIHCKEGLRHGLDTLQQLIAKAVHETQSLANAQPSASILPSAANHEGQLHTSGHLESAHAHVPTAGYQNARDLAEVMWTTFGQELLCKPSDLSHFMQSVSRLDAPSLAAQIVGRMCDRGWQGLDCASMSALLSVLDLVGWQRISSCITTMAHVTHQQPDCSFSLVLEGFEALLMFQGDTHNMWAGKVHSLAIDVAILLAHCALRTKLKGCGGKRPSGCDATLQQRFVLASVQAFTRCLAAPGGLQHTGLRRAYSDLTHMFIQQKEAFPAEQVLAPACARMASRQDNAKLARSPALLKLMVHCMTELQQLTVHPPDWSLKVACPARRCKCRQLCQDVVAFLHHPESCVYQAQTDIHGWRHLRVWVRQHDGVQCEEEQSGAVMFITLLKTFQWHDTLMQCYNQNCAWLQVITEATNEVMLLLISEAIRTSPSQRS